MTEVHDCNPPSGLLAAFFPAGTKFWCPACNAEWVRKRCAKWGTYWSTKSSFTGREIRV